MDQVGIVNRALQLIGKRTTVTSAELSGETSNEAKQANLAIDDTRQELLRMAPWNCGLKFANMTLITAAPGTPENNVSVSQWAPGLPPPPWSYEYQYPVDCLRPCWIVPIASTGVIQGTPIYPVATGFSPNLLTGPLVRFKVATDSFLPVSGATVAAGGSGYVVGERITLATTPAGVAPIGAPVILEVATLGGGGAVATVAVVGQVNGASPVQGGSYFNQQTNPVAQGSTTGVGTGATFNLTYGTRASQRVILTNLQNAILAYITDQRDINVMDPLFQDAWINAIAARLCFTLNGDKALANSKVALVNKAIIEARTADGNEGPEVDDRTPDWIRVRGYASLDSFSTPGFDWGGLWPLFA